ncbi:MAG: flagellar assembly protein FliW [Mariprofundaceae bacterium]
MKHLQLVTAGQTETDNTFHFPQGMTGFPNDRNFAFIYSGSGDIICMQSVDCPELAFLLTPWDEKRLGPPPSLSEEHRTCLQLSAEQEPLWMLVLNPFADKSWVTANLQAPVAIHAETRIGTQCVRCETDLELRYQWMPQPEKAA